MAPQGPYPRVRRHGRAHRLTAEDPSSWGLLERVVESLRRRLSGPDLTRRERALLREIATLGPAPRASPKDGPRPQMLLCQAHLEMGMLSARALMLAADRPLSFIFHDDGTLGSEGATRLARAFPGSRIVTRSEADARAQHALSDYPTLLRCRARNVWMLKATDLALWCERDRILGFDSDVIFFRAPAALLDAAALGRGVNLFMQDFRSVYAQPEDVVRKTLDARCEARINSGVFVLNRGDVVWSKLETWLKAPVFADHVDVPVIEQQLLGMLAADSPNGVAHLPDDYDMRFGLPIEQVSCRHYAGHFRQGFALEGIAYLTQEFDVHGRWRTFCASHAG